MADASATELGLKPSDLGVKESLKKAESSIDFQPMTPAQMGDITGLMRGELTEGKSKSLGGEPQIHQHNFTPTSTEAVAKVQEVVPVADVVLTPEASLPLEKFDPKDQAKIKEAIQTNKITLGGEEYDFKVEKAEDGGDLYKVGTKDAGGHENWITLKPGRGELAVLQFFPNEILAALPIDDKIKELDKFLYMVESIPGDGFAAPIIVQELNGIIARAAGGDNVQLMKMIKYATARVTLDQLGRLRDKAVFSEEDRLNFYRSRLLRWKMSKDIINGLPGIDQAAALIKATPIKRGFLISAGGYFNPKVMLEYEGVHGISRQQEIINNLVGMGYSTQEAETALICAERRLKISDDVKDKAEVARQGLSVVPKKPETKQMQEAVKQTTDSLGALLNILTGLKNK